MSKNYSFQINLIPKSHSIRRKNTYNREKAIEEGKAFMKIYEEQSQTETKA